jgi:hypothetical protein
MSRSTLVPTIRVACLVVATLLARQASAAPKEIKNCKTIHASGSFVLAGNLDATGDCLLIAADFVSIDLDGYTISGNGTGSGVRAATDELRKGIRIFNGTIRGFETGIDLGSWGVQVTAEHLHVNGNSNVGIAINGQAVVKDCVVSENGDGINVGSRSLVTGNDSSFNTASGIVVGVGSTIIGNTVGVNGNNGLVASNSSTVLNNTAQANTHHGIGVTCASNVMGNTADLNGTNLFLQGTGCNVSGNVAP